MTRREGRGTRRDEGRKTGRPGGGLFTGVLIGVAMGMAMAAGVAWYLNMAVSPVSPVEEHAPAQQAAAETSTPPQEPAKPTPQTQAPKPQAPKVVTKHPPKTETAPAPRPKVNYTFYGILPGDKPARPVESPTAKDTWWLQIAALSDARKADQIRAKLVMLNLPASTQKIDNNGQPLYRIRVGPYKREDDAFGDLDVLTENDFNARLLKDPVSSN